jgi:hypothetical protein
MLTLCSRFSLRTFSLVFGVLLFAACGGGGSTPSTDLAPVSIASRTIVVQDPTQSAVTTTYTFTTSNYTSPTGDTGTYTYAKIGGTTTQATLHVNSSVTVPLTYVLTFTSTSGGTYVDQSSASSTFTIH